MGKVKDLLLPKPSALRLSLSPAASGGPHGAVSALRATQRCAETQPARAGDPCCSARCHWPCHSLWPRGCSIPKMHCFNTSGGGQLGPENLPCSPGGELAGWPLAGLASSSTNRLLIGCSGCSVCCSRSCLSSQASSQHGAECKGSAKTTLLSGPSVLSASSQPK